jgi:molecular chaperone DnaK (HSP70)
MYSSIAKKYYVGIDVREPTVRLTIWKPDQADEFENLPHNIPPSLPLAQCIGQIIEELKRKLKNCSIYAVITATSGCSYQRRRALRAEAEAVGIKVLRVGSAVGAIALACAENETKDQTIMSIDVGTSCVEVGVVQTQGDGDGSTSHFFVQGVASDTRFGEDAIASALLDCALEELADTYEVGLLFQDPERREKAVDKYREAVKKLTSDDNESCKVELEVIRGGLATKARITLTKEQVEACCLKLFPVVKNLIKRVLKQTSDLLSSSTQMELSDIDSFILVGMGSCNGYPKMKSLLQFKLLGGVESNIVSIRSQWDADNAVAYGTALYARMLHRNGVGQDAHKYEAKYLVHERWPARIGIALYSTSRGASLFPVKEAIGLKVVPPSTPALTLSVSDGSNRADAVAIYEEKNDDGKQRWVKIGVSTFSVLPTGRSIEVQCELTSDICCLSSQIQVSVKSATELQKKCVADSWGKDPKKRPAANSSSSSSNGDANAKRRKK